MKCQHCKGDGQKRVSRVGKLSRPVGVWCDGCWAKIEARVRQATELYDKTRGAGASEQAAYQMVSATFKDEPS